MTSVTISNAIAPVAALIMPGLPPTIAVITAIQKDAYKPTLGSTPAMMEKAMASGMRARGNDNAGQHVVANIAEPVLFF